MADLQKIVYLTDAQYSTLVTNGTITIGDTTINYSPNDLYLTPSNAGGSVPSGGTTGQVLTKASNADGDLVWGNQLKMTTITESGTATQTALSSGLYYDLGWRYESTITLSNSINKSDLEGGKIGNIQIYSKFLSDTEEGTFDLNTNAINRPTLYGVQGSGTVRTISVSNSDIALISFNPGTGSTISTITIYSKVQNIIGAGATHYVEFNIIK